MNPNNLLFQLRGNFKVSQKANVTFGGSMDKNEYSTEDLEEKERNYQMGRR